MISMPIEAIEARANMWALAIGEPTQVIDGRSMIGGGSLPEESLPTKLLAISGEGGWLNDAAHRLRVGDPAIVARIDDGRLLLDPRTVDPPEDEALIEATRVVA
ncbi:MAG: L-seryl-tRNA(Sec) selenium transferase, partial [Dehalococcoidia bacterium]